MKNNKDLIEDYLNQSDWRVKENSNMGFSLQGLNNHIVSHAISDYWLNYIYPKQISDLHRNGDFHIHDLSSYSTYCLGHDLKDILVHGFSGVAGKVQSGPPKHFRTALGQLNNFFFTLQGESAGAQAVSSFDTLLAPFVRYDGLTQSDVKQAMQEFLFNLNVPTRVGFQSPFTNITMDITPSPALKTEPALIGGQLIDETYADFQEEMNMINIAFCDVMMEGDYSGRVFTFPIPTYNITESIDWDSHVMTKIFEMTAKYGVPYFSNFINSDMDPDDVRSMCCRLRIDNTMLRKRGGGLFGANPKTGSINVTTINLPRIGYLSNTEEELTDRILSLMDAAKEQMVIKRNILEEKTKAGLYPYSSFYMKDVYERFGEYWKNHFSTIGIIGANEMLLNFNGEDITTDAGAEFVEEVMGIMRERLLQYQEETGDVWNLEATPAEGTTRRLAAIDKEKYPDIITAGTTTPYYTNSTQLPVGYTDDVFEALQRQENLQKQYTGGTVFHAFLGEAMPSAVSVKKLVKRIAYNYEIPYFTITPTFSVCPKHGYLAGEHFYCPSCDVERGIK